MDSHDLPRSLVPARLPSARPQNALMARPSASVHDIAPSPQLLKVTVRGARRYWWLVLGLWIFGSAALAAGVYLKVQPMFESEAYLQVELQQRNLFDGGAQENPSQLLETMVQLCKSQNVLANAAADPKAAELPRIRFAGDPVLELRRLIMVRTIPNTYLISVSMSSKDPYEAATLVNAVVDAFIKANNEWSDGLTRKQIERLESYRADLKMQSEEQEKRWKDLASKGDVDIQIFPESSVSDQSDRPGRESGIKRGSGRANITVEQSRDVQRQLLQVKLDLAQAEAWVAEVRDVRKEPQPPPADPKAINEEIKRRFHSDPEVIQLGEQLLAAQDRVREVQKIVRNGSDPALRKLYENAARLQNRYDQMWEVKSASYREGMKTGGGADPDVELRDAEFKLKNLQIQKEALETQMKELRVATRVLATDEVEIALIRDEREVLKAMLNTVQRKLEDLRYATKDGARIRLHDRATVAGSPVSDNRLKYYAMTPVGVLAAALALAVLMELRSGRVSDPDQLSSRVRHEVFPIAPLPAIRSGVEARNGRDEQKLARFVQSLDHLRVALCDGVVEGEGRCVLITSATGGEGKTTLSAHLAARCANAGTSIVLIDADLRRASLGHLLDVPFESGLADVLNGDSSLEDALVTVEAGGFHFLSAGTPGVDPSRVLSSPRLPALINQLRATYDLVLIDSPPILPVPDALLLGRYADGVVMASRFDASRLPLVERASRQLSAANIPIFGVVVNGAQHQATEYGHYSYAYHNQNRREQGGEEPVANPA